MFLRERLHQFKNKVYRTDSGLLMVDSEILDPRFNVIALLKENFGNDKPIFIPGHNDVTTAGDTYYAQLGANETPDNDFTAGGLELGTGWTTFSKADTGVATEVAGSYKALTSGYPTTNDADVENTNAAVDTVTWTYNYLTSEANSAGIDEGAIVNVDTTAGQAALNHFQFSPAFEKTASDTLKVIINHAFEG